MKKVRLLSVAVAIVMVLFVSVWAGSQQPATQYSSLQDIIDQHPDIFSVILYLVVLAVVILIFTRFRYFRELLFREFSRRAMIIMFIISLVLFGLLRDEFDVHKYKFLKENGEDANAVIYEFSRSGKNGRNTMLHYNYIVNGIEYKRIGKWYPNRDTLSVGDTIIIKYSKEEPARSKPVRDLDLSWWNQYNS
jgi:FlaA1/EpsC-like NDP-sugar epimerase